MINAVEHNEVTANRQSKAVWGVQEGRYIRKGSMTMSGKTENIKLYRAFCSASLVRRLEISDSCSVIVGLEHLFPHQHKGSLSPSSSSSSLEASESSSSDGYLKVFRSLVVAIVTFEKLREFAIFKSLHGEKDIYAGQKPWLAEGENPWPIGPFLHMFKL
jgi:hypothetical protein